MNMKITAAIAVGFLTLAAGAQAQESALQDKPFSIKLGAAFPGGFAAQNNGGKTLLAIGTDYVFSQSPGGRQARSSVYFDGQFGSKNSGHVDIFGFGVAFRTSAPVAGGGSGVKPYAGVGAGFYRQSVKNGATGISQDKDSAGGKAFAGIALGGQFFAEASYLLVPKTNGMNASGFGLQIGTSF